jgi:hypothetical protein
MAEGDAKDGRLNALVMSCCTMRSTAGSNGWGCSEAVPRSMAVAAVSQRLEPAEDQETRHFDAKHSNFCAFPELAGSTHVSCYEIGNVLTQVHTKIKETHTASQQASTDMHMRHRRYGFSHMRCAMTAQRGLHLAHARGHVSCEMRHMQSHAKAPGLRGDVHEPSLKAEEH